MNYEHRSELTVRSYECDIGKVVNNSVYFQFLEHSKCEWLKTMGIDYGELAEKNFHFVVSKVQVEFKFSLRYGDKFWIGLNARRPSNYHLTGDQDIYRSDGKTILLSKVTVVFMNGNEITQLPRIIIDKYPLENAKPF